MKKGFVELVFIVDRSGSMAGLEEDTIGGFNAMLKEQQNLAGEAVVTTVLFDNQYELLHDRINIRAMAPLERKDYTVRGSTALLDAVGLTIRKIRKVQENTKEEFRAEKILFVIITDGQENASKYYTFDMVKERVERQKTEFGWEFIFFGANMDAILEAGKIGVAADRARNYCADASGTQAAYAAISAMSTAFRTENPVPGVSPTQEDRPQSARAALENLKKTVRDLKVSANRMAVEFSGLARVAMTNGGKLPDVNEIARKMLEDTEKEEKSQ